MDSLGKYFSAFLAVIILYLLPLQWMGVQQEALITTYINTETTYFIDSVRNLGYMSQPMYLGYLKKLFESGEVYETELVHFSYRLDLLDTAGEVGDTDEEEVILDYMEHYDEIGQDEIIKILEANTEKPKRYFFRQGDFIAIKVKNKNKTLFTKTAEKFMRVTLPTEQIVASYGGMIRNEAY